jgi:hypothetical protein
MPCPTICRSLRPRRIRRNHCTKRGRAASSGKSAGRETRIPTTQTLSTLIPLANSGSGPDPVGGGSPIRGSRPDPRRGRTRRGRRGPTPANSPAVTGSRESHHPLARSGPPPTAAPKPHTARTPRAHPGEREIAVTWGRIDAQWVGIAEGSPRDRRRGAPPPNRTTRDRVAPLPRHDRRRSRPP